MKTKVLKVLITFTASGPMVSISRTNRIGANTYFPSDETARRIKYLCEAYPKVSAQFENIPEDAYHSVRYQMDYSY